MRINYYKSRIGNVELYEAKSIEEQMQEVTANNEPIQNTAPMVYTERKDGVQPQFDIRTDRFEIAQEAMGKVSQSYVAKREEAIKARTEQKTE